MTMRSTRLLLLACIAYGIACGSDSVVNPLEGPVLHDLQLTPATRLLVPGREVQLTVEAHYRWGKPAESPRVRYGSSAPAVAEVSDEGLITAISAGVAEISASATFDGVTRRATMTVTVKAPPEGAAALVVDQPAVGWQPSVTSVGAGRAVTWVGVPHTAIWLYDDQLQLMEELKLSDDGFATHTFETLGEFHFCSGTCWDPPERGRVVVKAVDMVEAVYDLTAYITRFDPAWGDLTGYQYSALLTLTLDLDQRPAGTFKDLHLLNAGGESESWPLEGGSGFIRTFVDTRGQRTFELVGQLHPLSDPFHWTAFVETPAEPVGDWRGSPLIEGTFGTSGHVGGRFVARRRTP